MSENLQNKLHELRKKSGYSQKYVAISVGVAPSIVSRWESGVTIPSRESIGKLCDLFQVSSDYLLGKSDDENMIVASNLTETEKKLIADFRSMNKQGQDYVLQTVYMAKQLYKKSGSIPRVESEIG